MLQIFLHHFIGDVAALRTRRIPSPKSVAPNIAFEDADILTATTLTNVL